MYRARKEKSSHATLTWSSESKDPRQALKSAKAMMSGWVNSLPDAKRPAIAHTFIGETVAALARSIERKHQTPLFLSAIPAELPRTTLDQVALKLATVMGDAAAELPLMEASYLIGTTYTTMLPPGLRSQLGIYYTPPALAERLLAMSVEAGVDWTTCRVLDPACGGGAFLTPVALRILQAMSDCEPAILIQNVSNRLKGFEVDPFAAWMSQAFLEITFVGVCRSAGRRLPQLIEVCDSLEQEPEGSLYDLVIGNPPYGRITLRPELRERYRRSLYGHANLYGVFTDLALRWTAPNGVIAYVTPTSFLAGEYFKALRSLLASEAPPVAVDFIADRKGIFENVLQETLLATYRRSSSADTATVHYIMVDREGAVAITPAGDFDLPTDRSAPWLLPRVPEHSTLISRMAHMPNRLKDWGYKVSTGPLVWNRHKDQLRKNPGRNTRPLIWSEAIAGPGRFEFRAKKKNHQPYFEIQDGDAWLETDKPCVLLQRTTAKEQSRRLIAAELPESLLAQHGSVVIENHLNMIRPLNGKPVISPAAVAAFLNSKIVDHTFRCISGSVAVSAFELENLPLPSPEQMKTIENLVKKRAGVEVIERSLHTMYLNEER